jgi:hypothetical protein
MARPIRVIPQLTTQLVAICGKCGKKLGGGFGPGGKQSLGKALRKALHLPKPQHAQVRLVETKCMKLCPKGAVTVADSRDPQHLLVVSAETPVMEVAARLGLA